jgi:hypothetical protein
MLKGAPAFAEQDRRQQGAAKALGGGKVDER